MRCSLAVCLSWARRRFPSYATCPRVTVLPHQINPKVPMGISYVVMRAMRKTDARYDSAEDMAKAIQAAYSGGVDSEGGRSTPLREGRQINQVIPKNTKRNEEATGKKVFLRKVN